MVAKVLDGADDGHDVCPDLDRGLRRSMKMLSRQRPWCRRAGRYPVRRRRPGRGWRPADTGLADAHHSARHLRRR
jgi:hypothetical protein